MSVTSSSYSKKQQAHPQKPATMQAPQQQHSPGSNEMKLTAQQSTSDDKSLFDNDASNNENETKSVSSLRSQDRYFTLYTHPLLSFYCLVVFNVDIFH